MRLEFIMPEKEDATEELNQFYESNKRIILPLYLDFELLFWEEHFKSFTEGYDFGGKKEGSINQLSTP